MRGLKKYWITLAIGLLLVLGFAWMQDVFHQVYPVRVLTILTDAFFVVGAVITGAGLLVFITNEGTFDMLVYGFKSTANAFRKNGIKKYDSYYDYRADRANRKMPFLFLVICGLVFLAVAVLLSCITPAIV